MDVLEDIYEHPAYGKFRNEEITRIKIKVLDSLNELKSLIADGNLTERITLPNGDMHYKECNDNAGVCCICCRVDIKHAQIRAFLDDIRKQRRRRGLLTCCIGQS